jgi:outer membrane biosynthesis protein TonB
LIKAQPVNSKKVKTEPKEEPKEEPVVKNDIISKLREADKNDKRPRMRTVDKEVSNRGDYSVIKNTKNINVDKIIDLYFNELIYLKKKITRFTKTTIAC